MQFSEISRCKKCLISKTYPGIKLNDKNICNQCIQFDKKGEDQIIIKNNHEQIHAAILQTKGTGGIYDAIVAYSGGKDSTYTLKYLKQDYDLNILALLIDNDFIAERAFVNAKNVTRELGIDLMVFKPDASFMHKLYRKSIHGNIYNKTQLKRANAACLSCINLINNIILNEAIIRNIPLIAGGYIGGQIPATAGTLNTSGKLFEDFRKKNKNFLSVKIDPKVGNYLNIAETDKSHYPIIINPMLGMNYSEDVIIRMISDLGWKKPKNTGLSSSNCQLNDYAISAHYDKYKYHSYEAEICLQVRRGTMTKDEAMKKLSDIKPLKSFSKIKNKLGV